MAILLVEDDLALASFIVRELCAQGIEVDHVVDGAVALAQFDAGKYQLLLTDLMLPGLNGVDLVTRLRAAGHRTPILMLTACDQVEDRVAGLTQGADDYLGKPFAFEELLARIRALLRRHEMTMPATLTAGDLVVDTVRHEVHRGGKLIYLTAREYTLLLYLLRHKNQMVSRTDLLEHVWDMRADCETNVVNVYIRYLRSKIDDPYDHPLINTRRGAGYMIQDSV